MVRGEAQDRMPRRGREIDSPNTAIASSPGNTSNGELPLASSLLSIVHSVIAADLGPKSATPDE